MLFLPLTTLLEVVRVYIPFITGLLSVRCLKAAYTPTESSRVQSSPVRLTRMRQALCGLLTMAAAAVRTHQQSRVKSREACRVKSLDAACSIFVSQTLVIGSDGYYLEEEMDVEKLIILVKDHEAIFDDSRCEHWNRDYIASIWLKIAQEMGVGKWNTSVFTLIMAIFITTKTASLTTVIMFLLLLGLIFNVFMLFLV